MKHLGYNFLFFNGTVEQHGMLCGPFDVCMVVFSRYCKFDNFLLKVLNIWHANGVVCANRKLCLSFDSLDLYSTLLDKFARFVVMMLASLPRGSCLLPATNVHFRYAGHVMNMSARMVIRPAPSARQDTNATKVSATRYMWSPQF